MNYLSKFAQITWWFLHKHDFKMIMSNNFNFYNIWFIEVFLLFLVSGLRFVGANQLQIEFRVAFEQLLELGNFFVFYRKFLRLNSNVFCFFGGNLLNLSVYNGRTITENRLLKDLWKEMLN